MPCRNLPDIISLMTASPPSLGARIRRARERAKLSQEELANAVGASVRAVGDWENDRRKPRNRLGAIEEVLGISLDGEPDDIMPPGLRDRIRETLPPDEARRVEQVVEATLRGEPLPDFRRPRAGSG